MTPVSELPDGAIALFRGSPDGFISARDRLATDLRDQGRAEEAKAVKALRKPTVVAWALNQLSARDPNGVQALLVAGAEVRAAQQSALSSKRGAADRLQAAGAARKGAIADLTAAAIAALGELGRGAQSHADAIARALETSSVDADAGAALAAGTFERPPAESPGFGDVFGLTSLEGGAGSDDEESPSTGKTGSSAPARAGATGAAELRAEVASLRRDRDALARVAKKSRQAADGFAHELEGMHRRIEVVARKHADASTKAAEAETELARAEQALRRATDKAERG